MYATHPTLKKGEWGNNNETHALQKLCLFIQHRGEVGNKTHVCNNVLWKAAQRKATFGFRPLWLLLPGPSPLGLLLPGLSPLGLLLPGLSPLGLLLPGLSPLGLLLPGLSPLGLLLPGPSPPGLSLPFGSRVFGSRLSGSRVSGCCFLVYFSGT